MSLWNEENLPTGDSGLDPRLELHMWSKSQRMRWDQLQVKTSKEGTDQQPCLSPEDTHRIEGEPGGLPPMPASTFIQMPSGEERWARNPQEKTEVAHRVHECWNDYPQKMKLTGDWLTPKKLKFPQWKQEFQNNLKTFFSFLFDWAMLEIVILLI